VRSREGQFAARNPGAIVHYGPLMSPPAEIVEVERWEQRASEHVQRLEDDLAHLVSSRGMLIVRPVL